MRNKNAITQIYMNDPRHFADFFNGYIYHGKEVLRPECLSEVDTSSIAMIPYKKGENRVSVQKYRDIIKKAILMQSTVTVYWGTKPWDGPTRLKEMLTYVDEDAAELVDDINCNLFSIIDAENMPEFKTELNELFHLLAKRNSKDAMLSLLNQNEKYQNIDKDTAYMMREFANINLPRKSKKGTYNMCKAIEELKQENQMIGENRGREQGIEAFVLDKIEDQYPKDEIIKKLVKRFSLAEAKAVEYFEKYSSVLV